MAAGLKVGGPKGFWDTIKSVSAAEIAREANRPISIAIVGTPEQRENAIQALYDVELPATKNRSLPESPFVQGFDDMSPEARFPRDQSVFDFVIDLGAGRADAPESTRVYAIVDLGGWDATLARILEDRPELALALARNFPVFRRRVAQKIITHASATNAQFALLTGITAAVPLLDLLLPATSLSDFIMLTKNQAMMTLRLAAAYGLPVDYRSRARDLAPVLANGFGWRAIAREIVGAIPFGVGIAAKASIAYAGTASLGKAVQYFYETGETVTAAQAKRLYRDAYETAREKVKALSAALKKNKGSPSGKMLPPGDMSVADSELALDDVAERQHAEPVA